VCFDQLVLYACHTACPAAAAAATTQRLSGSMCASEFVLLPCLVVRLSDCTCVSEFHVAPSFCSATEWQYVFKRVCVAPLSCVPTCLVPGAATPKFLPLIDLNCVCVCQAVSHMFLAHKGTLNCTSSDATTASASSASLMAGNMHKAHSRGAKQNSSDWREGQANYAPQQQQQQQPQQQQCPMAVYLVSATALVPLQLQVCGVCVCTVCYCVGAVAAAGVCVCGVCVCVHCLLLRRCRCSCRYSVCVCVCGHMCARAQELSHACVLHCNMRYVCMCRSGMMQLPTAVPRRLR